MSINTLILDFDGTLADTSKAIVTTFGESLRKKGIEVPPVAKIKSLIGLPLKEMFVRTPGVADAAEADELCTIYREIFGDIAAHIVSLFPGVKATLETCHESGLKLGIATSRGHESLDWMLSALGLKDLVDVAVAEEEVVNKKPAADMALEVMKRLGAEPRESMVVGDTTFDIKMGQAAGCHTCGVSYGNHTERQIESAMPDFIIDDFSSLLAILSESPIA